MLTAAGLRELFEYDPTTGVFTRLVYRSPNAKPGDIAGTPGKDGYVQIQIDGKLYKAHRLAWLYVKGEWPPHGVDHRDTIKSNNAWINLRAATPAQNAGNCGPRTSNTSGYKGVCRIKKNGKWMAQIQIGGRFNFLGYFETAEQAHAAYCVAAELHFGEFSRAA